MRRTTKILKKSINLTLITSLVFLSPMPYANTTPMAQTKNKLKQLDEKIGALQQTLNSAQDKNKRLTHELAIIEKKISASVEALRNTARSILNNQHKIDALQEEINGLNTQLHQHQSLLAKHLRARYMMGEYQPLKWLLNQDTPQTTNRLLTFYQYVLKSRQKNIDQIYAIQTKLTENQQRLRQELNKQVALQQEFNQNQKKLEQDKHGSMAIIHALDNDIQSSQQVLHDFQHNKDNLTRLLKSLNVQNIMQNQRPFIFARKKLPQPVNVDRKNVQKINQGLVFYAAEGAAVTAVYPGKVVFSDWLKGYGLLLIIDHGRGFMTLYAHNQSLFKQKGDPVNQGEQIAAVGHSGGIKQNGLYFEIRQRGKAISPLAWLS